MDEKKHKLVIDGNAFYELDLECQKKKEEQERKKKNVINRKHLKRQRD